MAGNDREDPTGAALRAARLTSVSGDDREDPTGAALRVALAGTVPPDNRFEAEIEAALARLR
ncbi:hypothetical protein BTM25_14720 [Actinomadura rubteroloni]|uniref:Uncharacterized protein n=1 Tax=Actinomadura rubteroloni TaxID=1926885 RepID=A0A2P4UPX2_9ACTN|nr:hypothetical protein [Actinomadura rubteroloni]POM27064.1 hypothetical protein BTM25_14720 [Actinomadura rubteroloni]